MPNKLKSPFVKTFSIFCPMLTKKLMFKIFNHHLQYNVFTGRVSMFTSGSENLHCVEKVTSGTRYALTVSFTCDQKHAIDDPSLHSSVSKKEKQ